MTRIISIMAIILLSLMVSIGCSNGRLPLLPADNPAGSDGAPLSDSCLTGSIHDDLALLGSYNLTIDPETQKIELSPKRNLDLGQSYLVNGESFFSIAPCEECFNVKAISWGTTGITVTFNLKHPFDKGDPTKPPTAKNRLDLDVFDVALLVRPVNTSNTYYALLNKIVPLGVVKGQDGYTAELQSMLSENTALPYFLAVDNSDTGTSTFNKFEMGSNVDFDVDFMKVAQLEFELYITMGYGWSAKLDTRLTPLYFNPEYNRKAAWKVEAKALGYWKDNDDTATTDVEVKVYDWQTMATVYSNPDDFQNAPSDNIYASSTVKSVSAEIPGMTTTVSKVTSAISGLGTPGDPLVFRVPLANENLITEGLYTGLVKVLDERPCLEPTQGRDFLVDSPNGISFEYYTMTEYATYQTFRATVTGDSGWVKTWGGTDYDFASQIAVDEAGFIYVTGASSSDVDLDPDPDIENISLGKGYYRTYISKFNPGGQLMWVNAFGSPDGYVAPTDLVVDTTGRILIIGFFWKTIDFNPDPATTDNHTPAGEYDIFMSEYDTEGKYIETIILGGLLSEYCDGITLDASGNIYIAGSFSDTVDFDPSGGITMKTSAGSSDAFLVSYDSAKSFRWVQTWGGVSSDSPGAVVWSSFNDRIMVTGKFEQQVDFNPADPGQDLRTSVGEWDIFYSLFDSGGNWNKSRTWGGSDQDLSVTAVCDSSGNFYVGGYFRETVDFDTEGGIQNKTSNGMTDCFITKFNPDGIYLRSFTWGGDFDDEVSSIAFNSSGDFYVTGAFQDVVDFDPSLNSSYGWGILHEDIFVSKFDSSDNFKWVYVAGGSDWDEGYDIATYLDRYVYITGAFYATVDFDPDIQYQEYHSRGISDAFLLKLLPNGQWKY